MDVNMMNRHPGADPEIGIEDRRSSIRMLSMKAKPDVPRPTKPEKVRLYQSESHKMKTMSLHSAAVGLPQPIDNAPNPIWKNFPTRCVQKITTVDEMRKKLHYYTHSDDVMVVRYSQPNCTACNALDKIFEFVCHEQKSKLPNLHFYEISKDEVPELTTGLVRYPQIKGFSGGQWTDLEFKPAESFREGLFLQVEKTVSQQQEEGHPVSAIEAEEMYFSAAGPAMKSVTESSIVLYYCKSRARLHNYFKQVSLRRSWFYKKFIEPNVREELVDEWRTKSVFGERVIYTAEPMATN